MEHRAWTVPLSAWPGTVLPDWTTPWRDFGNFLHPHAALELGGAFVPVVALTTALAWRRRVLWRAVRWELGLLGVVMLLCMLPSPGVFRWSFRWGWWVDGHWRWCWPRGGGCRAACGVA